MKLLLLPIALIALLSTGAMFGFFYAWVCSTMWGLDNAPPIIAIEAMQAMNASVRNGVFALAFFGTPIYLIVAATWAYFSDAKLAGFYFFVSAFIYVCFAMILTINVNVPMNEALAIVDVNALAGEAGQLWLDYSSRWQFWNQVRTAASGIALLFCGMGLVSILPTKLRLE